jgi:hypothetical protein
VQLRRGVFQPYADLAKLFRKQPVISTTTSWIFTATPYILFASTLSAGLLVPTFTSQTPLNFAGNIIALVYLLALGTFFLILAGLDAGSAFGGMGSSREAIVASLTEPAMILPFLPSRSPPAPPSQHHCPPKPRCWKDRDGSVAPSWRWQPVYQNGWVPVTIRPRAWN